MLPPHCKLATDLKTFAGIQLSYVQYGRIKWDDFPTLLKPSTMETRKGLITKLGLFVGVAVTLVIVGKKHIAAHKEARHMDEYEENNLREEFDLDKKKDKYDAEDPRRESRYIGAGASYSSRVPGDRLSFWSVFRSKSGDNEGK